VPPRALNPAITRVTSDAILWAMSMRVDQRPQTVREFLDGLPATNAESVPPPPTWLPPPAPDPVLPPRVPQFEADTTIPSSRASSAPQDSAPLPPRIPRPT